MLDWQYGCSFKVTESDRAMLESWLRAPTVAQGLALRAKVILASAEGEGVRPLARRLGVSPNTVAVWRRRYRSEGLAGLRTKPRPGRPRRITAAKERAVISATLRKPKVATHWSARRLAKEVGLSSATVHRLWQKYALQPHRSESFKFSRDPEFEGKLADISGSIWTRRSGPLCCVWMKSRKFRRLTARSRRCLFVKDCECAGGIACVSHLSKKRPGTDSLERAP
jgi:transposase